ncbi:MAG TPA: DUF883 C-terminal domain-containing protein [Clostridia bacterium]|nr:DUF883 C-terminal domain-containing protein [Clostridia bacterium]
MDTKEMTEKVEAWQDEAEKLEREAATMGETLKQRAQAWRDKARTGARDAGAAADRYVHEHTWSTIGLVALTAGVIGYLLGSRRD